MANILSWWQYLPLTLQPEVFSFGAVTLYWYGVFFLLGAGSVFYATQKKLIEKGVFQKNEFLDFAFWGFLVVLLGAKIFFLVFYWWPFEGMALPRRGLALPGMSFFGGGAGLAFYVYGYSRFHKKNFWQLTDEIVLWLPLGIFFGRLGNFFHGELWGRITDVPWGMYFPGSVYLRHPSSLYAAFLEGIFLFGILFFLRKHNVSSKYGILTACFCFSYGILRFGGEFFREADSQVGYISFLTLNQIFAALLIVLGGGILLLKKRILR